MIVNRQIGGSGGAPGELGEPTVATSTGIVTATVTKGGVLEEGTSTTLQLSKQAAKTVTPSSAAQTAVSAGKYTTGAVTVAAVTETTTRIKTGTFSVSGKSKNYTISGIGFRPKYIIIAQRGSVCSDYVQSAWASAGTPPENGATTDESATVMIGNDDSTSLYTADFYGSGKIVFTYDPYVSPPDYFSGSYSYVVWGVV